MPSDSTERPRLRLRYEMWGKPERLYQSRVESPREFSGLALRSALEPLMEQCPHFDDDEERTDFTRALQQLYERPVASAESESGGGFRAMPPTERSAGMLSLLEEHPGAGNREILERATYAIRHHLGIDDDSMPLIETNHDRHFREVFRESCLTNEGVKSAIDTMGAALSKPESSIKDPHHCLCSFVDSLSHEDGPHYPSTLGVPSLSQEVDKVLRDYTQNGENETVRSAARTMQTWCMMVSRIEQGRILGNRFPESSDSPSSFMNENLLLERAVPNRVDMQKQTDIRSAMIGIGQLVDLDCGSTGDTMRGLYTSPLGSMKPVDKVSKISAEDWTEAFRTMSKLSETGRFGTTKEDLAEAFRVINDLHSEELTSPWKTSEATAVELDWATDSCDDWNDGWSTVEEPMNTPDCSDTEQSDQESKGTSTKKRTRSGGRMSGEKRMRLPLPTRTRPRR